MKGEKVKHFTIYCLRDDIGGISGEIMGGWAVKELFCRSFGLLEG